MTMERGEYIRRWSAASKALWLRALALVPWVWGGLGALILAQPSGRLANLCWFVWVSSLAALAIVVGCAVYAAVKAGDARKYPGLYHEDYTEPWRVGTGSEFGRWP